MRKTRQPRLNRSSLQCRHPVTIQDGGIEPIYLAFRSEITPALQAKTAANTIRTFFFLNLYRIMYSTAPVDGHWGRWSSWGTCSATCDNGTRVRTRKCDDPIPANSGKPCHGDDEQQKACIIRRCSSGRYIFPLVLLEDLKMDREPPGKYRKNTEFFPNLAIKPLNNRRRKIWILHQVTISSQDDEHNKCYYLTRAQPSSTITHRNRERII